MFRMEATGKCKTCIFYTEKGQDTCRSCTRSKLEREPIVNIFGVELKPTIEDQYATVSAETLQYIDGVHMFVESHVFTGVFDDC